MGAHGLNWKIFATSEVKFGNNDKNYFKKQIFMPPRRVSNLAIFEIFEMGKMANIFEIFLFIIFAKYNIRLILVKFEAPRLRH